jgi:hypothetical protein
MTRFRRVRRVTDRAADTLVCDRSARVYDIISHMHGAASSGTRVPLWANLFDVAAPDEGSDSIPRSSPSRSGTRAHRRRAGHPDLGEHDRACVEQVLNSVGPDAPVAKNVDGVPADLRGRTSQPAGRAR